MIAIANGLFLSGLVAFLTGLALIDYRAALVFGGAGAMGFALQLARANTRTSSDGNPE